LSLCDPSAGCQTLPVQNGTACNDGLACTTGESCESGVCEGGDALDCSALGDPCTVGACIEAAGGCVAQPRPDGTLCDDGRSDTVQDACHSGVCTGEDAAVALMSLTADLTAPQPVGTAIRFTAVASAGGRALEYRWWIKDGGQWVMEQDWGSSSSFVWTPNHAAADYRAGVWVRAVGAEQHVNGSMPFPIEAAASGTEPTEPDPTEPGPTDPEPVTVTSLAADLSAPQDAGTAVTITAGATGGGGSLEYRWWIKAGGQWVLVQDWSSASSFVWTPSEADPGYRVGVWVRAQGSQDYATASIPFPIEAGTGEPEPSGTDPVEAVQIMSLTTDRSAPQAVGTSITVTAVATGGGGTFEYRWWIKEGGQWVMAQDWSSASSFVWTPVTPDPSYKLGVWVRSAGAEAYDVAAVPFPIHGL
jgi:hypothetical protein